MYMNRFISFLLCILTFSVLGGSFSLSTSAETFSDITDLNTIYAPNKEAIIKPAFPPLTHESNALLWEWLYIVNENIEDIADNDEQIDEDDITDTDEEYNGGDSLNNQNTNSNLAICCSNYLINSTNYIYRFKKLADSYYSEILLKATNSIFNNSLQITPLFIVFRNIRI